MAKPLLRSKSRKTQVRPARTHVRRARTAQRTKPPRDFRRNAASDDVIAAEFQRSRALRLTALLSMVALASWVIVALFEPVLPYKLVAPPEAALDSGDFLREISALTNARVNVHSRVTPVFNGETFYPAE